MLELIFVIIILGIVSSIGAEMISKVYTGYITQRAQYKASMKTQLASQQIANRLASAIPGTVVRRLTKAGAFENITDPMGLDPSGDTYTVLQWVGSDVDSFTANATPGWSGFADVDNPATIATNLITPGSKLTLANTIITNLNGGALPAAWKPTIYFPNDTLNHNVAIPLTVNTALTLIAPVPTHVVEHYKFAWTSYALVVENGDLFLYYAFDPITGWTVPNGTNRSLLLKNVSTFRFTGSGQTIRFKICAEEQIGEDFNITSCKEKAVF